MKAFRNKFREKFANIEYGEALVGLLIAFVFIIIGSFEDYEFSKYFVSNDNVFGKIASYLGPLPGYAVFGSAGICFLISWGGGSQKDSRFLAWACCIIFPLLAGVLYGYEAFLGVISNKYLAIGLGILLVGLSDIGIYFLCRHGSKEEAHMAGITILFSAVTVIVLMYLLKKAGLRPRYLFLLEQNDIDGSKYFRNWWDFDASVKEMFPKEDPSMFESWPSGHAALASMSVLSVLYCKLNKRLENKTHYFVFGSFLFALLIDLGRVSDGHHYITDVAFGSFLSLLFVFLIVYLVYLPAPTEGEMSQEESEKTILISSFVSQLKNAPGQRKKEKHRFSKDKKPLLNPRKKAYRLQK